MGIVNGVSLDNIRDSQVEVFKDEYITNFIQVRHYVGTPLLTKDPGSHFFRIYNVTTHQKVFWYRIFLYHIYVP